ncbi:hypothetical protein CS379_28715 [Methylobacterium frigidaeris]|nr:hypothetical protein CS379_28715 [Methylobacterium frigidaeris]
MRRTPLPVLIGLALSGPAAAHGADFPTFAPRGACGLERADGSRVDPASDRGCLFDERAARRTLRRQWARLPPAHRQACREENAIGDAPSYVALLTCLQLADGALPRQPPPVAPATR